MGVIGQIVSGFTIMVIGGLLIAGPLFEFSSDLMRLVMFIATILLGIALFYIGAIMTFDPIKKE